MPRHISFVDNPAYVRKQQNETLLRCNNNQFFSFLDAILRTEEHNYPYQFMVSSIHESAEVKRQELSIVERELAQRNRNLQFFELPWQYEEPVLSSQMPLSQKFQRFSPALHSKHYNYKYELNTSNKWGGLIFHKSTNILFQL